MSEITRKVGETFDGMIERSDVEIERLEKGGSVVNGVEISESNIVISVE